MTILSVATVLKCLDEARDQDSKYRDQDQDQDQDSEARDQDKTKTVKMLSRDCLETRQCLEASHHWECAPISSIFLRGDRRPWLQAALMETFIYI